jgi:hypothetical protein
VTADDFCHLGFSHDLRRDHHYREMTDIDGRADRDFTRSRYALIALSAAFSISMMITPLGHTRGRIAPLNRFARLSGGVNEPLAPIGISSINYPTTDLGWRFPGTLGYLATLTLLQTSECQSPASVIREARHKRQARLRVAFADLGETVVLSGLGSRWSGFGPLGEFPGGKFV